MREILVVNPRKAAGRGRKKVSMARRKKRTKRAAPATRKYRRKNPRTRRSTARRVGSRLTSGLSIRGALKDQIPIQIGMLAAQWSAKRFGPDANELDPTTWSWASYAKCAAGAFGAAMLCNMVKPGMGQKVLTGGLSHVVHRLVRNELVEKSTWGIAQFGADDDEQDQEGIYVDDDGTPYAASGGDYLPLDEQHRMLPSGSTAGYGDSLVTPGPLGQLEPVGPLGDDFSAYSQAYQRS